MGLDKVIISQLAKVAKDSGKLNDSIDAIKDTVLEKGLALVEESGIDTSQLPVNIPQYLRGESPTAPANLSSPSNLCAMPSLTAQQAESTIRKVNAAQISIESIYTTTNSIKSALLDIRQPISGLSSTVQPIERTVSGVSNAIKIIKLLPFPVAVLGIGIPANVLTIFSSTLDSLDKLLGVAKSNLKVIPQTLAIMTELINESIDKLNAVEKVIDPFLQVLVFVKATAELRPQCPAVTQKMINTSAAALLDNIEGNLAQLANFENPFSLSEEELELQLNENSDPGLIYKNFKFVLEFDEENEFIFPARRIRCTRTNTTGFNASNDVIFNINSQTNPLAEEGEYSYSADLNVLVQEAKFAVDTFTNNIVIWNPPQVRDQVRNVPGTSTSINIGNLDTAEIEKLAEFLQVDPSVLTGNGQDYLPAYIQYGGTIVNLNNTPTNIEFGVDRLGESSYTGGTGIEITSFIQSGTIQVNSPVSIRMKTFGGTGDPSDGYTTGLTESLLTIKRSFNIQDDIDPFTGRVAGFDQTAIDNFIEKYGSNSITILNDIYQAGQEITDEFDGFSFQTQKVNADLLGGKVVEFQNKTYKKRLKIINQIVKEFSRKIYGLGLNPFQAIYANFNQYIAGIGSSRTTLGINFGSTSADLGNKNTENVETAITRLYNKTKPILYNQQVLNLSKQLYGKKNKIRTIDYIKKQKKNNTVGGVEGNQNWYWTARKNAFGENVGEVANTQNLRDKAVTLAMMYQSFEQFEATYTSLYGSRGDYNNGAWVGAASTIPIIPTNVDGENDDITIPIQVIQEAGRNETIDEVVGELTLLGTYSYDLEIIDSLPKVGGLESAYPTNFTRFFIELVSQPEGSGFESND